MQEVAEEQNLPDYFRKLSAEQQEMLIGSETDDALRYGFSRKRVVHPGQKGSMIAPEKWPSNWNLMMSQEGERRKRAAYIHIPFCQSRCLYCGFFQNYHCADLEEAYIARLTADLERGGGARYVSTQPVQAVYIGGGTPSSLSAVNIRRLLQTIRKALPLANDCEITFEARIHDFGDDKIEACLNNGVNRFSFGVQSFNTKVRKSVGRLDDRETVLERLRYLHSFDQAAVVLDLIYGLPYQDMTVWLNDVETLTEAAIDGADLYQLNVYERSALKAAIDKGQLPPAATTAEQAVMFAAGIERMAVNNFRRLSICHWANSGRERNLYNSLTKMGAAVLPFGAGAGGNIDGVNIAVDRDVQSYMKKIDQGEKPLVMMLAPHPGRELHTAVRGQLEQGYLNFGTLYRRFGTDLNYLNWLFEVWRRRGLVDQVEGGVRLTTAGQFWYVNITQSVLECLEMSVRGPVFSEFQAIAAQG